MLYSITKPILWLILKILFLFKVRNKPKNLPEGRLIVCANHISNFDVLLLLATFDRKVSVMGKKELFENEFTNWLLRQYNAFPIDRQGADREAIRVASNVLQEEKVLGIFPEGTRVKDSAKRNREAFNNGIAMIANKNKANILPATIKGDYKLFSGVEIIYHDIIKIDEIHAENKKELYDKIVDEVYNKIYSVL